MLMKMLMEMLLVVGMIVEQLKIQVRIFGRMIHDRRGKTSVGCQNGQFSVGNIRRLSEEHIEGTGKAKKGYGEKEWTKKRDQTSVKANQ